MYASLFVILLFCVGIVINNVNNNIEMVTLDI